MGNLLSEVAEVAQNDTTVHVTPGKGLHFTFFSITPHLYTGSNLPPHETLLEICLPILNQVEFVVHDLRLIALPDCLILGGIPTRTTYQLRHALAGALLQSDWKAAVRARHGSGKIPIFWHTTIARSLTPICSASLQKIFKENQNKDYGSLSLPSPSLRAVSFDWSICLNCTQDVRPKHEDDVTTERMGI